MEYEPVTLSFNYKKNIFAYLTANARKLKVVFKESLVKGIRETATSINIWSAKYFPQKPFSGQEYQVVTQNIYVIVSKFVSQGYITVG